MMVNETVEAPVAENPFNSLSWNEIRRWAAARGIGCGPGTKLEDLRQECFAACPDFAIEQAPRPTRRAKAQPNTPGSWRVVDEKGNIICIVYGKGRNLNGVRDTLPMEENARKIAWALDRQSNTDA